MSNNLLYIKNASKHFGGVKAINNVGLSIDKGQIYGLIGPNGAGKTTFFNLITGIYPADSGIFILDGSAYRHKYVHQVVRAGIARTFQNIRLFPSMTSLENVMVGFHSHAKTGLWGAIWQNKAAKLEELTIAKDAQYLLDYVGLVNCANKVSSTLAYGHQRLLEIARALATKPKLLALDEPAAGMNSAEKLVLQQLLQKIRADGVTILLIEHDVKLVMNLCDQLTVLDYGQEIAQGTPEKIRNNPIVIAAYLGATPVVL